MPFKQPVLGRDEELPHQFSEYGRSFKVVANHEVSRMMRAKRASCSRTQGLPLDANGKYVLDFEGDRSAD